MAYYLVTCEGPDDNVCLDVVEAATSLMGFLNLVNPREIRSAKYMPPPRITVVYPPDALNFGIYLNGNQLRGMYLELATHVQIIRTRNDDPGPPSRSRSAEPARTTYGRVRTCTP